MDFAHLLVEAVEMLNLGGQSSHRPLGGRASAPRAEATVVHHAIWQSRRSSFQARRTIWAGDAPHLPTIRRLPGHASGQMGVATMTVVKMVDFSYKLMSAILEDAV